MAQAVGGFAQLHLGRLQQIQHFLQSGVVLDQVVEARDHAVDLRQASRVILRQDFQSVLRALHQAGGMGQAAVLGLRFFPFRDGKIQRRQLFHLPFQALQFLGIGGGILFPLQPRLLQRLPFLPGCRGFLGLTPQAGIGVEQLALGSRLEQGLMGMLAVYVDQEFAGLAQLLQGGGAAVDEGARTAAGIHHAAHQAHAGIAAEFVLVQPGLQLGKGAGIELGLDLGALGTGPHHAGIGTFAQCQRQGVDQDGFAGPGLAGKHGEAGLKFQLEAVDDDEITDIEGQQHNDRGMGNG